jgi:hypothetical protein
MVHIGYVGKNMAYEIGLAAVERPADVVIGSGIESAVSGGE